jgi:hypothetical protein
MSEQLNSAEPVSKKNFTKGDDEQLVKLWAAISVDSVVGNGQTSDKLWSRILTHFRQHPVPEEYVRDAKQLESRWRIISRAMTKWHGALEVVRSTKPSGYNDADIVR